MGLQSLIPQTGGSAAWGGIGGTLADQTDLSAALGLRALLTANTFTGAQVFNVNGAVSTPAVSLTGTIFAGGSATTTKPQLLIEPSGTTSTAWSTNGTLLGLNAPSGFTGNLFDFKVNNTTSLKLSGTVLQPGSSGGTNLGQYNLGFGTLRVRTVEAESGSGHSSFYLNQDFGILCGASGYIGFAPTAASSPTLNDAFWVRKAPAAIQQGANSATPVNQTFSACSGVGTNIAGGKLSLAPGQSTGNATPAVLALQGTAAGSSGSTAQTLVDVLTIVREGVVRITNIPTSSAGLSTGDIYSNAGILTIV